MKKGMKGAETLQPRTGSIGRRADTLFKINKTRTVKENQNLKEKKTH